MPRTGSINGVSLLQSPLTLPQAHTTRGTLWYYDHLAIKTKQNKKQKQKQKQTQKSKQKPKIQNKTKTNTTTTKPLLGKMSRMGIAVVYWCTKKLETLTQHEMAYLCITCDTSACMYSYFCKSNQLTLNTYFWHIVKSYQP